MPKDSLLKQVNELITPGDYSRYAKAIRLIARAVQPRKRRTIKKKRPNRRR